MTVLWTDPALFFDKAICGTALALLTVAIGSASA